MNKLYFDIETIPAPEHVREFLSYLHKRKDEKKDKETDFEKFFEKTSLDGAFGRIACICYGINDTEIQGLSEPDDEKTVLEKFWEIAANIDLFVGHNIHDFDLPFIVQRSVILGVKPTWQLFEIPGVKKWDMNKFLDFARYKSSPIFDTMWEWSHWGDGKDKKTLEHIALSMGFPTPKEGIDGSKVWEFYKNGKLKEIINYCKKDVETTRLVYKKMTFENLPNRETLPF